MKESKIQYPYICWLWALQDTFCAELLSATWAWQALIYLLAKRVKKCYFFHPQPEFQPVATSQFSHTASQHLPPVAQDTGADVTGAISTGTGCWAGTAAQATDENVSLTNWSPFSLLSKPGTAATHAVQPLARDVQKSINPTICLNLWIVSKNRITWPQVINSEWSSQCQLREQARLIKPVLFRDVATCLILREKQKQKYQGTADPALAASCFNSLQLPPQSRDNLLLVSPCKYTYMHFVSIFEHVYSLSWLGKAVQKLSWCHLQALAFSA